MMSNFDSQEDGEEEDNWMDTKWAVPYDTSENIFSHQQAVSSGPKPIVSTESSKLTVNTPPVEESDHNKACKEGSSGIMNRMRLNDNKAGMDGLDKEKINQIIHEASKGSRFYENERKKEQQMNKRIEEQKTRLQQISDIQLKQGQIEADKLLDELERSRNLSKIIVHIDMDAFYAAVEMRDKPSLKDKPMAVGGMSMLSTSNYHARKYGVRAAMPGFIAKKLCPELIIVPTNFDKYTEVSKRVREILAEYDPNFSPMSLDEAYLDMSEHSEKRFKLSNYERTFLCRKTDGCSESLCNCDLNLKLKPIVLHQDFSTDQETVTEKDKFTCPLCGRPYPDYNIVTFGMSPDDAVNEMRCRIEQKTRLTASAGIAPNTMLAKVCSDKNKPNGQYRILPERAVVMEFITNLPTRKISGIGKVSETMLNALDIYTCSDLYNQRALLYHLYSQISFNYFMRICLGIGSTMVERDSERKSISTERTFQEISKPEDLYSKCEELSEALSEDLKDEELKGKTVSIKIKTVQFEVKTRAHTVADHTNESDVIYAAAKELLKTEIQAVFPQPLRLRLMGVRMSSLLHQSLCKKKQNTITGLFKRMGHEKQKQEKENYCKKNVENVHGDTNQVADLKNSDMTCDSQVTDGDTPGFILKRSKQSEISCDSHVTDWQDIKTQDMNEFQSSDSECNDEREVDFDMSIIKCPEDDENCVDSKQCVETADNSDITEDCKLQNTCNLIRDIKEEISSFQVVRNNFSVDKNETGDMVMTKDKNTPINMMKPSEGLNVKTNEANTTPSNNYVCPVCQEPVECESLLTFNQHIDICLNKTLVKDCTKIAHEEDRNLHKSVSSHKLKVKYSPKNKPKSSPKPKSKKKGKPFTPISSSLVSQFCMKTTNTDNKKEINEVKTDKQNQKECQKEMCVINIEDDSTICSTNITASEKRELEIAKNRIALKEKQIKNQTEQCNTQNSNSTCDDSSKVLTNLVCPVCFMEQKGNNLEVFNEHVDTCLSKDTITEIVKVENTSTVKNQKRVLENAADKQSKKRQKISPGNRTIDSFFK